MRSLAVLCVVAAHTIDFLGHPRVAGWSGITGVCFFFVHTSLVLMFSLERDPSVGSFYLRRAFRIYPLWLVMVGIITVFRLPQFPPTFTYAHPGVLGLLSNVTLTFNLAHRQEIVGAGWTLPIEVDMYLFLPVLFFFVRQVKQLWPLLVLDVFIMVFNHQTFGYVSWFPMCVPCFLPGIMAYLLWDRTQRRLNPWLFPMWLFLLIGLNQKYGNWRHNWISCLLLGLSLPFFREISWQPLKRAAHIVAKYSYGIYLTHLTAVVVFTHILRSHSLLLRIPIFLLMLVIPPLLLYHFVEEPMIKLGSRLARHFHDRWAPRITEGVLNTEPAP